MFGDVLCPWLCWGSPQQPGTFREDNISSPQSGLVGCSFLRGAELHKWPRKRNSQISGGVPCGLLAGQAAVRFMIIPYDWSTGTAEILHCFHAFSNKLCVLSTPPGIWTQFRKTNALFMMAISTAWLYTDQLNSSLAFLSLFLPITACSYKCLTSMHCIFYTAFNGEHLK